MLLSGFQSSGQYYLKLIKRQTTNDNVWSRYHKAIILQSGQSLAAAMSKCLPLQQNCYSTWIAASLAKWQLSHPFRAARTKQGHFNTLLKQVLSCHFPSFPTNPCCDSLRNIWCFLSSILDCRKAPEVCGFWNDFFFSLLILYCSDNVNSVVIF